MATVEYAEVEVREAKVVRTEVAHVRLVSWRLTAAMTEGPVTPEGTQAPFRTDQLPALTNSKTRLRVGD